MTDEAKKVEDAPETPEKVIDDEAEFDAAFASFSEVDIPETIGGDPEPVLDDAADPASESDPAPVEATGGRDVQDPEPSTDSIWDGATDQQKAAHETALADQHRWNSDRGRAATDARRIAELESRITAQPDPNATSQAELDTVFQSDNWKRVETELEDLAAPVKQLITVQQQQIKNLETRLSASEANQNDATFDDQKNIVTRDHPDWESVAGEDAFLQWVGQQPTYRQEMLNRNADKIIDGAEASHLLTLYKAANNLGQTAPEPPAGTTTSPTPQNGGSEPSKRDRDSQRRLDDNVAVKSSSRGGPSGPPDEFDGAFDFYAAQGS